MSHRDVARIATRQLGLVTRSQVLSVATPGQLTSAVRSRRLEPVRTGVYRIAGSPETWEQHLLGACLAGGPGAAASFASAAWLWRIEGYDRPSELEITVPRGRRARLPGVRVHDTQVTGSRHFGILGPIPVTSPSRTLCDATAFSTPWRIERGTDDALRRRITSLSRLTRVFLDLATQGRRRSTIMRAVLDDRLPGFQPGDSNPEQAIVRWLAQAGLPEPVQQHRVAVNGRSFRLDVAYPNEMIDIEYDGWDAHRLRSTFDADRDRDAILELAGWLVLRFTSRTGRATLVERVATALDLRHTPSM